MIPSDRAVWIRAAIRSPGEFRIRLAGGELNETWTSEEKGDHVGRVLICGADFGSPLSIHVEQRVDRDWDPCRTVQTVVDSSAVTAIWVGAEALGKAMESPARYRDVLVFLIWTDMHAAADFLAR